MHRDRASWLHKASHPKYMGLRQEDLPARKDLDGGPPKQSSILEEKPMKKIRVLFRHRPLAWDPSAPESLLQFEEAIMIN